MLFCTNINLKWDHNSAFYFITSFPLNNISLTYFHDNIYGTIVIVNSCPTLCNPMDCSTASFPVLHHLPEFAQTLAHWVGDAVTPIHPGPFTSALNLSQVISKKSTLNISGQSIGASTSKSCVLSRFSQGQLLNSRF